MQFSNARNKFFCWRSAYWISLETNFNDMTGPGIFLYKIETLYNGAFPINRCIPFKYPFLDLLIFRIQPFTTDLLY